MGINYQPQLVSWSRISTKNPTVCFKSHRCFKKWKQNGWTWEVSRNQLHPKTRRISKFAPWKLLVGVDDDFPALGRLGLFSGAKTLLVSGRVAVLIRRFPEILGKSSDLFWVQSRLSGLRYLVALKWMNRRSETYSPKILKLWQQTIQYPNMTM